MVTITDAPLARGRTKRARDHENLALDHLIGRGHAEAKSSGEQCRDGRVVNTISDVKAYVIISQLEVHAELRTGQDVKSTIVLRLRASM